MVAHGRRARERGSGNEIAQVAILRVASDEIGSPVITSFVRKRGGAAFPAIAFSGQLFVGGLSADTIT